MGDENKQLLTPDYQSPALSQHSSPSRSSCDIYTTDCDADVESNVSATSYDMSGFQDKHEEKKVSAIEFFIIFGGLLLLAFILIVFLIFQRQVTLHHRDRVENIRSKTTFFFERMKQCGKTTMRREHALVAFKHGNGGLCRFHDIDTQTGEILKWKSTFSGEFLSTLCISVRRCFAIYRNGLILSVNAQEGENKNGGRYCNKIEAAMIIADMNEDNTPDILCVCVYKNKMASLVVVSGVNVEKIIIEIKIPSKLQFKRLIEDKNSNTVNIARSKPIYLIFRTVLQSGLNIRKPAYSMHSINVRIIGKLCVFNNCTWTETARCVTRRESMKHVVLVDINNDQKEDIIFLKKNFYLVVIDGKTQHESVVNIPEGLARMIPMLSEQKQVFIILSFNTNISNCEVHLVLNPRKMEISHSHSALSLEVGSNIPSNSVPLFDQSNLYLSYIHNGHQSTCDLPSEDSPEGTSHAMHNFKESHSTNHIEKEVINMTRVATEYNIKPPSTSQTTTTSVNTHKNMRRREYNPMYADDYDIEKRHVPALPKRSGSIIENNFLHPTKPLTTSYPVPYQRNDSEFDSSFMSRLSNFIGNLQSRVFGISFVIMFATDASDYSQSPPSQHHQQQSGIENKEANLRFRRHIEDNIEYSCPNLQLASIKLKDIVISTHITGSHRLTGCKHKRHKIIGSILKDKVVITSITQYSVTGEFEGTVIHIMNARK